MSKTDKKATQALGAVSASDLAKATQEIEAHLDAVLHLVEEAIRASATDVLRDPLADAEVLRGIARHFASVASFLSGSGPHLAVLAQGPTSPLYELALSEMQHYVRKTRLLELVCEGYRSRAYVSAEVYAAIVGSAASSEASEKN